MQGRRRLLHTSLFGQSSTEVRGRAGRTTATNCKHLAGLAPALYGDANLAFKYPVRMCSTRPMGKPCIMRNVAHLALLQLVRNSGVHPHYSGSQLSSLSMILARAPPPLAAEKPGPEHVNELF